MEPLDTARLILRRWRDSDREPFARINADPRVMEFFPSTLTRVESDALIDRAEENYARHGFGPNALELRATGELVGFTGLFVPAFEAHFTPCVEIGWRLAAEHWGKGLATEAARAVLDDAFTQLHLAEIVSFTATTNTRSQRVMKRLGMTHNPDEDFNHPDLPQGHPLQRHVLYRIRDRHSANTKL